MKYFSLLCAALLCAACQTEDPLEEIPQAKAVAVLHNEQAQQPAVIYYAPAKDLGSLTIGKQLIPSFTVNNMRNALMDLFYRRPLDPSDGRIGMVADELAGLSYHCIQTTHYYIVFAPRDKTELERLEGDGSFCMAPVPLDHEINGMGTLPEEPADFDPETGEMAFNAPMQFRYAIVPITEPLPEGVYYSILEEMYIPTEIDAAIAEAAHIPILSRTMADLLIDQALYVSGAKTGEELVAEKIWKPSGCIQVWDTKLGRYVGVPSIKVYAYNIRNSAEWVYTDRDGNFQFTKDFKGPVNYYLELETRDYKILKETGRVAYCYCGTNINGPLYFNITNGALRGCATIARALSSHYYGQTNVWERVSDFRHENYKFTINFRNSWDSERAGKFHFPTNKNITVWGLNSSGTDRDSKSLLHTMFHELGHAAMYYRCKKGGRDYDDFEKIIRESWAEFTGWFMTKAEYEDLGYVYPRYLRNVDGQSFYFDKPDYYNRQEMSLHLFQTKPNWEKYTPLFIDLIDDSNQRMYFSLTSPEDTNVYPEDNIVVTNYGLMYVLLENTRNLAQLKSKLLMYAQTLGTTEEAINDYFAFYGI